MSNQLQSLMQKEISRKEFLGVLGLALVSIFGLGHVVKLLTGKSLDKHPLFGDDTATAYGGRKH